MWNTPSHPTPVSPSSCLSFLRRKAGCWGRILERQVSTHSSRNGLVCSLWVLTIQKGRPDTPACICEYWILKADKMWILFIFHKYVLWVFFFFSCCLRSPQTMRKLQSSPLSFMEIWLLITVATRATQQDMTPVGSVWDEDDVPFLGMTSHKCL